MKLYVEKDTTRADLKRDWQTLKSLKGFKKIEFIYDYYKWYILAILFAIFVVITAAHLLYEGHRYCRLRVDCVLNAEEDISEPWFNDFTEKLTSDGEPGLVDINHDQPFDYDNSYYYVMELEVMTQVSAQRIDMAICNADMYSYLLALNACAPLDEFLPEDLYQELSDDGVLLYATAGEQIQDDGTVDTSDTTDGWFAIDASGTEFAQEYDQTDEDEPLYCVIIRNTEHLDDCVELVRALFGK